MGRLGGEMRRQRKYKWRLSAVELNLLTKMEEVLGFAYKNA